MPPPLGSGGRGTLAMERVVGRVPIPARGHTLWYSLYICTLWGLFKSVEIFLASVQFYSKCVHISIFNSVALHISKPEPIEIIILEKGEDHIAFPGHLDL